jgi:uncharacterized membrane protein
MWQNYLQWLLMLVVFIVLLVLGWQNTAVLEQSLQFQVFNYIISTKVIWAIMVSFGSGVGIMLILSLIQGIGLRMGNRSLRKENEHIRRELTKLRNLNVDGGIADTSAAPDNQ